MHSVIVIRDSVKHISEGLRSSFDGSHVSGTSRCCLDGNDAGHALEGRGEMETGTDLDGDFFPSFWGDSVWVGGVCVR